MSTPSSKVKIIRYKHQNEQQPSQRLALTCCRGDASRLSGGRFSKMPLSFFTQRLVNLA
ncbi:MAG: hypothetical protein JZU64_09115 [Rhodoferax sp.]|nr:hypothetical protein [Rhodoferax sp.]